MEWGVNLYSVRNLISNENGYIETCKKIKEMGASYIQHSGAPFDIKILKREIEEVGLPIVLTHVPMDRILNDTDNLMSEHEEIGCHNIGLGMMPLDIIKNEEECLKTINRLNEVGKKMREKGFKLFYHFHHFEFLKLSTGERIIDYMIKNCEYINFTADILLNILKK